MEEAKKKLFDISNDKGKYQTLLKDLVLQVIMMLLFPALIAIPNRFPDVRRQFPWVTESTFDLPLSPPLSRYHTSNDSQFQGMYQLMEESITVQCRKADIPMVEAAIAEAAKACAESLKINVKATVDKEHPLPEGRCVVWMLDGRKRGTKNSLIDRDFFLAVVQCWWCCSVRLG